MRSLRTTNRRRKRAHQIAAWDKADSNYLILTWDKLRRGELETITLEELKAQLGDLDE